LTLRVTPDQDLTLSDLRGKPVILAFYPADWSPVRGALFVLDRQGTIAWSYCSPIAVNPGADGILDAVEKLSDQANAHGQLESTGHAT
jgi:peroxiredoxin